MDLMSIPLPPSGCESTPEPPPPPPPPGPPPPTENLPSQTDTKPEPPEQTQDAEEVPPPSTDSTKSSSSKKIGKFGAMHNLRKYIITRNQVAANNQPAPDPVAPAQPAKSKVSDFFKKAAEPIGTKKISFSIKPKKLMPLVQYSDEESTPSETEEQATGTTAAISSNQPGPQYSAVPTTPDVPQLYSPPKPVTDEHKVLPLPEPSAVAAPVLYPPAPGAQVPEAIPPPEPAPITAVQYPFLRKGIISSAHADTGVTNNKPTTQVDPIDSLQHKKSKESSGGMETRSRRSRFSDAAPMPVEQPDILPSSKQLSDQGKDSSSKIKDKSVERDRKEVMRTSHDDTGSKSFKRDEDSTKDSKVPSKENSKGSSSRHSRDGHSESRHSKDDRSDPRHSRDEHSESRHSRDDLSESRHSKDDLESPKGSKHRKDSKESIAEAVKVEGAAKRSHSKEKDKHSTVSPTGISLPAVQQGKKMMTREELKKSLEEQLRRVEKELCAKEAKKKKVPTATLR